MSKLNSYNIKRSHNSVVEYQAVNLRVEGSNPSGIAIVFYYYFKDIWRKSKLISNQSLNLFCLFFFF